MKVGLKEALLTLWDQLGILGIWPEVAHIFPANQMRGTEPINVEKSDLKEPWICPSGKPKWNMALKLGRKSPGVFKLCAFILFNFILVGRSYFILPS